MLSAGGYGCGLFDVTVVGNLLQYPGSEGDFESLVGLHLGAAISVIDSLPNDTGGCLTFSSRPLSFALPLPLSPFFSLSLSQVTWAPAGSAGLASLVFQGGVTRTAQEAKVGEIIVAGVAVNMVYIEGISCSRDEGIGAILCSRNERIGAILCSRDVAAESAGLTVALAKEAVDPGTDSGGPTARGHRENLSRGDLLGPSLTARHAR